MDILVGVFAPLCASLLLAFVFVIYAACHAGGCNDAHIESKENHAKDRL